MIHRGNSQPKQPIFIPDRAGGEFAQSGTRGPIRFVFADKKVGLYSTTADTRSLNVNSGAIVRINDNFITHSLKPITRRDGSSVDALDLRFGPTLPHSHNPQVSGSVSVTASMDEVSDAVEDDVRQLMCGVPTRAPHVLPTFWNYRHRRSNWLVDSTAPVFYEVSGRTLSAYRQLVTTVEKLASLGGCYVDFAERWIHGFESMKGNAGASKLLDRHSMDVGIFASPHFQLSFRPPTFFLHYAFVYFLPEQVIVVDKNGDALFVPYSALRIEVSRGTQMGVPVPDWCEPVGWTWKYMNKDGGPDRRYTENFQIFHYPVWEVDLLFEDMRLDLAFAHEASVMTLKSCLDDLVRLSSQRRSKPGS